MKKLVLFAVLVAFTALQAKSIPVMQYSNKCVMGCGSVWWDAKMYTWPDGTSFLGAEVKCRGFGFKSCPSVNVGADILAIQDVELEPWEATPIDDVVEHAWEEMDLGNSSGSYYVNYTHVSTGVSYQYTIVWTTTYAADESVEEIAYTIDRTELP